MLINAHLACNDFPCSDVAHAGHNIPRIDLDPSAVRIVLISECAPTDPRDGYYRSGAPLFEETTVAAFRDAGARVESVDDILALGVYLTTAVKCAKTGYGLRTDTIKSCAGILEQELVQFPWACRQRTCR